MTASYATLAPIADFTNSYRLYSTAELQKDAAADDVLSAAMILREYRELARICRCIGNVSGACRYAALQGVALRSMRRAAKQHNN